MAGHSTGLGADTYRGSTGIAVPSPPNASDAYRCGPAHFSIELPFDNTVAGVARKEVTLLLGDKEEVVSAVSLVCTELVTNSFRHGSAPIQLTVLIDPTGTDPVIEITVTDGGTAAHKTPVADPEHPDESGRGQLIIDALTAVSSLDVGECVTRAWCRLPLVLPPTLGTLPTPRASKELHHGS